MAARLPPRTSHMEMAISVRLARSWLLVPKTGQATRYPFSLVASRKTDGSSRVSSVAMIPSRSRGQAQKLLEDIPAQPGAYVQRVVHERGKREQRRTEKRLENFTWIRPRYWARP